MDKFILNNDFKYEVYLLLGSNLGDRLYFFYQAISFIEKNIGKIIQKSSIYETESWGVENQPLYLNQVIKINTNLIPNDLIASILNIESLLGRKRNWKWEARVIDIDILYINDLVINTNNLIVPHPRLHQRKFTLIPLCEISPNFVHPVFKVTQMQLLKNCKDELVVKKLE
ncbi:MAG: 2-amino-4-hydroxy-6-hydroxymethyldihydropteridine diphosphokinase [Bacteroidia bacterium]